MRLRMMIGVQRSANTSAPSATGQYWPYPCMGPLLLSGANPGSPVFILPSSIPRWQREALTGGELIMGVADRSVAEDLEYKAQARRSWAAGDYHRFASDLVWGLGAELVSACGITPGDRVLDVAAGSGNTALRAADAGGIVVASDLTPENFAAGRTAAQRTGLSIDWVEADAERLPFADAEFDVVTSSVGAMWAPDHERVASELLRVCRPGGTLGMINFAADGLIADFLDVFAGYAAPPPWAASPLLWGDPEYVRQLFGTRVSAI